MNSLLLSVFLLLSLVGLSQNICDSSGNLLVYSNFEGGVLSINVDQDIEDLKIGVNSYYNVEVRLSGAYAKNVTGIYITGTGKKGPCGLFEKSSVSGAPAEAKVTVSNLSYFAPCGGFEGGVSCNEGYYDPTWEELMDYFKITAFPGSKLYAYKQQYECWTSAKVVVSQGGNCCLSDLEVLSAKAGRDKVICSGQKVQLGVQEFNCDYIKQTWSPAEGLDKTTGGLVTASPKKTTTYTVTMKNNGVETVDQVTVFVKEIPKTPVITTNSPVCAGQTLTLAVPANLGESYVWEGPGGFIATDAVSMVKDIQKAGAGTYTVHVDLNGCGTKTAEVKVIVKTCAPPKDVVQKGNAAGSGRVPGATTTKPVLPEGTTKTSTKPVATTTPTTTNEKTETLVASKPVGKTTGTKPAGTKPAVTKPAATKPAATTPKTGNAKYRFTNSRKNGVFIVDGFTQPIDDYETFEVLNAFGEPIRCKRIKFGDKLIVDVSDKPFGQYTLVVSYKGTRETIEFMFAAL